MLRNVFLTKRNTTLGTTIQNKAPLESIAFLSEQYSKLVPTYLLLQNLPHAYKHT